MLTPELFCDEMDDGKQTTVERGFIRQTEGNQANSHVEPAIEQIIFWVLSLTSRM